MQNFKLVIEYDGTRFFGWQRQADKPTVQEEVERILSIILNQDIRIHGSGRTDAGVHARGQVAHFRADTRLTPEAVKKGVNSMMRYPVVIKACTTVSEDFHAQYWAKSKEYRYYILNRQEPSAIGRDYLWHVSRPLDLDAMNKCARHLIGVHDFKAFENTGSPRSTTVREIFEAEWKKEDEGILVFRVSASGFLKNMVRNIVGTLKDAGAGKLSEKAFIRILSSCDRTLAGATAPARGLFLHQVFY